MCLQQEQTPTKTCMHIADTLKTKHDHLLMRGALLFSLRSKRVFLRFFACRQLVTPGLRDLLFKACMALKNNLFDLYLKKPPLTRILSTEHTQTYLLEQKVQSVSAQGWEFSENLAVGGILTE